MIAIFVMQHDVLWLKVYFKQVFTNKLGKSIRDLKHDIAQESLVINACGMRFAHLLEGAPIAQLHD